MTEIKMDVIEKESIVIHDILEKITPIMVRDAVIECFYTLLEEILEEVAGCLNHKTKGELEEFKQESINALILSMFEQTKGDFDHPTKNSLIKVVLKLKDFAAFYKEPKTIEKHTCKIMKLIDKLN